MLAREWSRVWVAGSNYVAVFVDRFVFLFDANPANGDPLRLHYLTHCSSIW